jgi:DNA-binding transcriptional LysR family regulator
MLAAMEIYQLRAFLAVARTENLTRASEQLHLTQSAVSKQIKSLEEELGVLLFERSATGMQVTGAGRHLLHLAARTVDSATELAGLAKSMRGGVAGVLRLGSIIDPESIRLGALLQTLVQFYPQLDIRLHHGISGSILEGVRTHELDAGFFLGTLTDPDIAALQLHIEHYVVVAPHAWTERIAAADWAALAEMPWVGTPRGSSQHALVAQIFGERGLTHHAVVEADQEASMIDLVRSGMALCLMRERLARDALDAGHIAVWHGARIPCPLSLLYPRQAADQPIMRALLDSVRAVWLDGMGEAA